MLTISEEIEELMKEYNDNISRCVEIKEKVMNWMNNMMNEYDTSSVQPDELSEVFFQNTWCLPEALQCNLDFLEKWCPKIVKEDNIIDGEYREVK